MKLIPKANFRSSIEFDRNNPIDHKSRETYIRCILLLKIVVFIVKHLERRLQYIILTPPTIAIQF